MKKINLALCLGLCATSLFALAVNAETLTESPRKIERNALGVQSNKAVYFLDGKRISPEEYRALNPDSIANVAMNQTEQSLNVLTIEEIADGKRITIAATSKNYPYSGIWTLISENGQPQQNFGKCYESNNTFSVLYYKGRKDAKNGTSYAEYNAVQEGRWIERNGVITEACDMGNKGVVTIDCKFVGDTLVQTFSYPAKPDKQYVQKYVKLPDAETAVKVTKATNK